MDKISIILPSYNVEGYLEKCINSILNQSYYNLEIIIVNDGSTDNTLKVAKGFETIDKRVIVLDQINKGVSAARNIAIDYASGEYIIFVDPDDFVHNDFVNSLYERLIETNSDMSICGHTKVYDNQFEVKSKSSKSIFTGDEIFKQYFIGDSTLTVLTCDKIFKTKIIKENGIYFPYEVTSGQDQVFILEYLIYCNSVSTTDNNFYYYYQRIGSKSKRYEYYIFEKTLIKLNYLRKILIEAGLYSKHENYYKIRLYMNLFSQGFLLYQYGSYSGFENQFLKLRKDSVKYINKNKLLLFLDIIFFAKLNLKEKIACCFIYYLPPFFVKKLYNKYLNLK